MTTSAVAEATPIGADHGDVDDNIQEEAVGDFTPTNKLLLLFQRLLLGNLYSSSLPCSPSASSAATPPSPISPHQPEPISPGVFPISASRDHTSQHAQGAVSVLVKYISLLHGHIAQILTEAVEHSVHIGFVSRVLKSGPVAALLPSLSIGLVLLQLRLPSLMVESRCLELMGKLMVSLDKFNRQDPNTIIEDSEDLAWPGSGEWVGGERGGGGAGLK